MFKRVFLSLLLGLCLISSVQAATIIWVSETKDNNGDGVQDDQTWVDWLSAQGHLVIDRPNYWNDIDLYANAALAELNAADLIIMSRNTNSGSYSNNVKVGVTTTYKTYETWPGKPTRVNTTDIKRNIKAELWNSVQTPIIVMMPNLVLRQTGGSGAPFNWGQMNDPSKTLPYTSPGVKTSYSPPNPLWAWFNATSSSDQAGPMAEVMVKSHPIFKGVPLDASGMVQLTDSTQNTQTMGTTSVGNGILLARNTSSRSLIVEFKPGVPFYGTNASPNVDRQTSEQMIPEGKRMLFCAGTSETGTPRVATDVIKDANGIPIFVRKGNDATTNGITPGGGGTPKGNLNLTDAGKTCFLNAIAYMMDKGGNAYGLSPADKSTDVVQEAVLVWKPGNFAPKHDVYFGTSLDDVTNATRDNPLGVLVSKGQDPNTYDPAGLLAFGQTYYWRIDEVGADSTIYMGGVSSLTAEALSSPITPIMATASSEQSPDMGPGKTIDGSGLSAGQHSTDAMTQWLSSMAGPQPTWIQYEFDKTSKLYQMQVWNSNQSLEAIIGYGAKDVVVEYSTDGSTWSTLASVTQLARATGTADYAGSAVDLNVAAKFVKITIKKNWGGILPQYGLSEVQFSQIPASARSPKPANNATNVDITSQVLTWRAGRGAVQHVVYMSTDPNGVLSGTSTTVSGPSCPIASLAPDYGRTYYWMVSEVDAAGQSVASDVWKLSTIGYAVVDNFNQYDSVCNRIFYAWQDGAGYPDSPDCGVMAYGGNGTNSKVGYDNPPFVSTYLGGYISGQAMPLAYDNDKFRDTGKGFVSETQRTWATPQDLTTNGINTLSVPFKGRAPAFLEYEPGSFLMNAYGSDIWGTTDQGRFAYKTLSGDGSIQCRVEGIDNVNAWVKMGVMIRETPKAQSKFANAIYGGSNGAHLQARLAFNASAVSGTGVATPEQKAARSPVWVKIVRTGDQFNAYYTLDPAGENWLELWVPQTVPMANTVCIGLCATSHQAGTVAGVRCSNVSYTGDVSGDWQVVSLGYDRIEALGQATDPGGNDPATFYVALQDSSGKVAVVSHPDPWAVASGYWFNWAIPLSEFSSAGVNLKSIQKMTIGVGNASTASGTGKLYIDDIRLTRVGP